jgi:hypothetical protein
LLRATIATVSGHRWISDIVDPFPIPSAKRMSQRRSECLSSGAILKYFDDS